MIAEIYRIAGTRESASLERTGDDDFSFSLADVSRFRCNAYRQRGTLAAVLRVVPFGLPDPATLHIPPEVMALAEMRRGLVLVTGSAGSGKSTTLACLIDRIDRSRSEHIITIEDPIEFLYPHRQSIVLPARSRPRYRDVPDRPCAPPCARRRTSSSWAKCAIMKPSPRP